MKIASGPSVLAVQATVRSSPSHNCQNSVESACISCTMHQAPKSKAICLPVKSDVFFAQWQTAYEAALQDQGGLELHFLAMRQSQEAMLTCTPSACRSKNLQYCNNHTLLGFSYTCIRLD